jgi:hypothetical protein
MRKIGSNFGPRLTKVAPQIRAILRNIAMIRAATLESRDPGRSVTLGFANNSNQTQ